MITAKQLNEWRVVPRIITMGYGYFVYLSGMWFMSIPEPNMAQAGFIATVTGASAAFFNFYVNSGK